MSPDCLYLLAKRDLCHLKTATTSYKNQFFYHERALQGSSQRGGGDFLFTLFARPL